VPPTAILCLSMGYLMKTTLNIDDTVMRELEREATRQGRTMSELVETALRLLLSSQQKRGRIPALPTFRSGGTLVDVADRDALYHAILLCRAKAAIQAMSATRWYGLEVMRKP
jgi:hypothetical protein